MMTVMPINNIPFLRHLLLLPDSSPSSLPSSSSSSSSFLQFPDVESQSHNSQENEPSISIGLNVAERFSLAVVFEKIEKILDTSPLTKRSKVNKATVGESSSKNRGSDLNPD